jgi:hypothetical protein
VGHSSHCCCWSRPFAGSSDAPPTMATAPALAKIPECHDHWEEEEEHKEEEETKAPLVGGSLVLGRVAANLWGDNNNNSSNNSYSNHLGRSTKSRDDHWVALVFVMPMDGSIHSSKLLLLLLLLLEEEENNSNNNNGCDSNSYDSHPRTHTIGTRKAGRRTPTVCPTHEYQYYYYYQHYCYYY